MHRRKDKKVDLGTGIATGATSLGFFSVLITGIVKYRKNGNNIFVRKDVCNERVKRFEEKVDTIAKDVAEIKTMIKNGR